MKITIAFAHTDAEFSGTVSDGRFLIFGYAHWRKKKAKQPQLAKDNRERVQDEVFQWLYRAAWQPLPKAGFASTTEFESWFFECVRKHMLHEATRGRLCVPANYPAQFWQLDFIKKLVRRLSKKPSARQQLRLNTEVLLTCHWLDDKLNTMTAQELSDWCGQFFQGQIKRTYTPKHLMKIATEELGLTTLRSPGPKGFATNSAPTF